MLASLVLGVVCWQAEIQPNWEQFREDLAAARKARISQIDAQIRRIRLESRKGNSPSVRKDSKTGKVIRLTPGDRIRELKAKKANLKDSELSVPLQMTPGSIGTPETGFTWYEYSRILSPNEVILVRRHWSRDDNKPMPLPPRIILCGVSTAGIRYGDVVKLPHFVWVKGTRLMAGENVWLLEPVRLEDMPDADSRDGRREPGDERRRIRKGSECIK